MNEIYRYPAIFTTTPDSCLVELVDFGTYTFGADLTDAYNMAVDLLGNCIVIYRVTDRQLPTPSEQPTRALKENEEWKMVELDFGAWWWVVSDEKGL